MTELITKGKIFDYIQQYPEAKTALLIWLKEFECPVDKLRIRRVLPNRTVGIMYGEVSLFDGFHLRIQTNNWLNTAILTWFGTTEELTAYREQERKMLKEKYPNIVTKRFTLVTGQRKNANQNFNGSKEPSIIVSDPVENQNRAPIFLKEPSAHQAAKELETESEYENLLTRAVAIFKAEPGTSEFDELWSILPLIKRYEEQNMQFPILEPLVVIKLKLSERHLIPLDLIRIIGSEEDVDLIFSGKKPLSKGIIGKLYRRLKISL